MSKTFKRDRVLTDTVKYEVLAKCVAISLEPDSCPEPIRFFASRKDWNAGVKKHKDNLVAVAQSIQRHYIYLEDKFWKKFDQFGFAYQDGINDVYEMQVDPFKAIKRKTFDIDKLVWFDHSSHLLYDLDSDLPRSIPYRVGYIGGITNEYFNLSEAEEILRANPDVWNIRKISIPYYNCSKSCNMALEFTVKLPQHKYTRICKYFKSVKNFGHWTCQVKDFFTYRPHWKDSKGIPYGGDVLGLKKTYSEPAPREESYDDYCGDDYDY